MTKQYISAEERGAIGDGLTLNTQVLQGLIDELDELGGGILQLNAPGVFLSGTLFLKDNITLRIEAGAKLLGSPNLRDYTELTHGHNKDRQPFHLLVAEDKVNITIEGKGCIDGNGEAFWQEPERTESGTIREPQWILAKEKKVSPLIDCIRCRNITIKDVTVHTGGGWNIHCFDCDRVRVDGINIDCHFYSPNSDGIDLTGCHDVMISNSYIRTCDDAIVLKTLPDSRTCEHVVVTNCILETACVALKLGATESYRDIRDINFSNCVVHQSNRAFALYTMAGGNYSNIVINNITCNTRAPFVLSRPIHIMATDNRCPEGVSGGTIRNVIVSNLIAETQGRILIHSEGSSAVENIILKDIILEYPYIENPADYALKCTSAQFPLEKNGNILGSVPAAVAIERAHSVRIEGMQIHWPDEDKPVPPDWRSPERIANGSNESFFPSYDQPVPCPFHAVWLHQSPNSDISEKGLSGIKGAPTVMISPIPNS